MTVVAVLNQKGGVGKTTLAVNLAHQWASQGLRVLVVDVDKQAAASATLLEEGVLDVDVTLADLLRAEDATVVDRAVRIHRFQSAVREVDPQWGPLQLVPASLDLEDVWASTKPGLVFRLRRIIDEASADGWDRVILDGPPDLGPGTVAACVAADAVVVPTRPERMSLQGVARTVETVNVVRRDMRPDVQLAGIVPVAVDRRLVEHQARVAELQAIYGRVVTETVVPHRLRSDEASGAGVPAASLAGDAGATFSDVYAGLCKELDDRIERGL